MEHLHDVGTFYFHQMIFTNFFCPLLWPCPQGAVGQGWAGRRVYILQSYTVRPVQTETQTPPISLLAGQIFLIEGPNQRRDNLQSHGGRRGRGNLAVRWAVITAGSLIRRYSPPARSSPTLQRGNHREDFKHLTSVRLKLTRAGEG